MTSSISDRKVRIALIGTGGIAGAHVRGMIEHKEKIDCVALCDVSEANLQRRHQQLGTGPRLFSDWKKMLAEMGDEIDAVDICLPHHLHAPAIFDAVAAGKHILCEKPLCIDLAEADRIVEAVKGGGKIFMPGHNQLFWPMVREARRMIDSGAIGRVKWLRSTDCFVNRGIHSDQWRAQAQLQGGGELIDTGYHPSYRLLYLAGSKVVEVKSVMGRFLLDIEGEDSASVVVQFANGAIGEIMSSWAYPTPHGSHQIHVIGEKGQIFGTGDVLYNLPEGFTEPAKKVMPSADTFLVQMGYFADCIREGHQPLHSVEESREVLQLILGASINAEGWKKHAAHQVG